MDPLRYFHSEQIRKRKEELAPAHGKYNQKDARAQVLSYREDLQIHGTRIYADAHTSILSLVATICGSVPTFASVLLPIPDGWGDAKTTDALLRISNERI